MHHASIEQPARPVQVSEEASEGASSDSCCNEQPRKCHWLLKVGFLCDNLFLLTKTPCHVCACDEFSMILLFRLIVGDALKFPRLASWIDALNAAFAADVACGSCDAGTAAV